VLQTFSAEYILECVSVMSCASGTSTYSNLNTVLNSVVTTGLPLDSTYPYVATLYLTSKPNTITCSSTSNTKAPNSIKIYSGHKVSTGTMKSWIAKNPVGAMIYSDVTLNTYLGGSGTYSCSVNSPSDSQLN